MAFDTQDELNRRRQEREERRRQQKEEQRKLMTKLIIAGSVLLAAIICICVFANRSRHSASGNSVAVESATRETTAETTEATTQDPDGRNSATTIHIRATGDLNITDKVILAGVRGGSYDFTACFQDVAGVLSDADLTVVNLEGNLCGEPYGSQSTSAPVELAMALQAAGVDIVQMANSCTVNNGLSGLTTTLRNLRSAGLTPIGAYATETEFQESKGYTICEIDGVTVAFVAFTKGVGERGLPAGSEYCVNLLYTDYATVYEEVDEEGIKSVLKAVAAEKPDITIAMVHWGSEYNDNISTTQEDIVKLMKKQGVDVIIGTHPHMVHRIDYDELEGTLVAYSLGDFFGDASRPGTAYSIVLDLQITKDYDYGTTTVTGYSVIPVYTLNEDESADGQRRVVRIEDAIFAYDSNFLNKVSRAAYDSLLNSLTRIRARIEGK